MGSKSIKVRAAARIRVPTPAGEQNVWSATDKGVADLAVMAREAERHYGRQMDIEWGATAIMARSSSSRPDLRRLSLKRKTLSSRSGPSPLAVWRLPAAVPAGRGARKPRWCPSAFLQLVLELSLR